MMMGVNGAPRSVSVDLGGRRTIEKKEYMLCVWTLSREGVGGRLATQRIEQGVCGVEPCASHFVLDDECVRVCHTCASWCGSASLCYQSLSPPFRGHRGVHPCSWGRRLEQIHKIAEG